MHPTQTPEEILARYWGHHAFRGPQRAIIQSVLDGHDTLAILPTGGGKSICFQVPAVLLDGRCLVISPLIALMRDQVQRLNESGIPALAIHSGMHAYEVRESLENAVRGPYKLIYVSPERLQSPVFQDVLHALNISLLAVDESHCISQWGYDFRPAYLRIAEIREQLPGVPVIALTASATPLVQADIMHQLKMPASKQVFRQPFIRPNLSYQVVQPEARETEIERWLDDVPGTAIIYTRSRNHTQQLAAHLQRKGIAATHYHAGLSTEERNKRQSAWIDNEVRVIVCTNAFGMGIDKPDVRLVLHLHPPDCLENYYQEAGRAGRDGKPAQAVLIIQPEDRKHLLSLSDLRYPHPDYLKQIYFDFMNYLEVPAGYGEQQSYPIQMTDFCTAFGHQPLAAAHALKALEQEGLFKINEAGWQSSMLQILADVSTLRALEQDMPELDGLVKAMLRAYGGVLDYPVRIHEKQLAEFAELSLEEVYRGLHRLVSLGLASYEPADERPQVWLLMNRMYQDSYQINLATHLARKKAFDDRVAAMIDYLENRTDCRTVLLGNYFGDTDVAPCGICDTCRKHQKRTKTNNPLAQIEQALAQGAVSPQQLWQRLPELDPGELNESIRYLLESGQIAWTPEGNIRWNR